MLSKSDLIRSFTCFLSLFSVIDYEQVKATTTSTANPTMAPAANKDLGTIEAPTTLLGPLKHFSSDHWPNASLHHLTKRQVYRGQNYHFQRSYELNRLHFENRNKDVFSRPKPFFLREFHLGRDMPNQLLELTQLQKLTAASATARPLIDTSVDHKMGESNGNGKFSNDRAKQMSDDYQKQYWATKASLKAALQNNEKDIRITELLEALKRQNRPKQNDDRDSNEVGGGNTGGGKIEQIKDDKEDGGGSDDGNKNVLFDEQIKDDLDKINVYDPKKPFGERIRPYTGGGSSSGGSGGGGGGVSGSSDDGGGGRKQKQPKDSISNQLRRLYPHLFPGSNGAGDSSSFGGGGADRGRYPQPGITGIGGSSYIPNSFPTSNAGGDGDDDGKNNGGIRSGGIGSGGGNGRPASSGVGGIGNGTRYSPDGGASRSAHPSRFPGNRISSLTLYPNVRNSTYPGIPGYIRYDFPGYNTIPYTGFRCDLQAYKQGYFADINAGCQVFHVCQKDGRMDSFLCPNGTLFHQKVMTCDWWYHVNCPASPGYYYLNGRIGVLPFLPATLSRFD